MKTAINGKVRIKFFWRCAYSGMGMTPISQLLSIGSLKIYKVVHSRLSPFCKDYYRADVIKLLSQHFDVQWKSAPTSENAYWYAVYSNVDGGYVGTPECAYKLHQRGLTRIQKANPKHKTCSIGVINENSFLDGRQKWYGWSHRAMYGFSVGDVVKEGDCCASSGWTKEYLAEHPEEDRSLPVGFTAKTNADAKIMAIAFAESVS